MKLTNSGFQRGYNPIVVEGDASDMNMDFGELLMEKGDTGRCRILPDMAIGWIW